MTIQPPVISNSESDIPAGRTRGRCAMKTRYGIYAGLVFLAFSTGTAPVHAAGSAADEVRAADDAWLKVYSAKDLDKSVAFFDERGSMLAPNAPIATGKPAVAKAIARDFAAGSVIWHADKAGVARSGDLGYTSGTYKSAFKDSSGRSSVDNGKYLTMWKKQKDGAWKVLFDMFNTDLPPS